VASVLVPSWNETEPLVTADPNDLTVQVRVSVEPKVIARLEVVNVVVVGD
jgi:hypothetical protein